MAAVHFTTITCEPNRAIIARIESHILANFIPILTQLYMQGLKFLKFF